MKKGKYRYNGFYENWKLVKLGNFVEINPKSFLPRKFKYVDLESVVGTKLIYYREEIRESAPSRAQRVAQKGDVFYQMVRPYQKNNFLFDINESDFVFSTGYAQLRPQCDSAFLLARLQEEGFINKVLERCTGTSYPSINSKDLSRISLTIPQDIDEQSAIGSLFCTLDTLLSSYKDNLVNYQSFKATMLSKMFPKAGQTVPEIRLEGFKGEWEKSKLKDVAHRVQGNDGRMDLPTLTISASGGWMNQIDRFSANIAGKEQKNYTLLKQGELSYNHGNSKLAKYGVVFELQEYEEALVPKVYHSFRVNQLADAKFIEIMFSTKIPDRELGKLISSGARMDGLLNISFDDFMNISIIIPTIKEQQAIGAYFSNLDKLISSYQEKISQLETLKKKLLQDMFI